MPFVYSLNFISNSHLCACGLSGWHSGYKVTIFFLFHKTLPCFLSNFFQTASIHFVKPLWPFEPFFDLNKSNKENKGAALENKRVSARRWAEQLTGPELAEGPLLSHISLFFSAVASPPQAPGLSTAPPTGQPSQKNFFIKPLWPLEPQFYHFIKPF